VKIIPTESQTIRERSKRIARDLTAQSVPTYETLQGAQYRMYERRSRRRIAKKKSQKKRGSESRPARDTDRSEHPEIHRFLPKALVAFYVHLILWQTD
jgi:hypothetical protein